MGNSTPCNIIHLPENIILNFAYGITSARLPSCQLWFQSVQWGLLPE